MVLSTELLNSRQKRLGRKKKSKRLVFIEEYMLLALDIIMPVVRQLSCQNFLLEVLVQGNHEPSFQNILQIPPTSMVKHACNLDFPSHIKTSQFQTKALSSGALEFCIQKEGWSHVCNINQQAYHPLFVCVP